MPTDLSGYPPEIAALLTEFNPEIEALMLRLERGAITVAAWQQEFERILAAYSQAAYLLGYGDPAAKVPPAVAAWLDEQFAYLAGFANTVRAAGGEYDPAWTARARMYGASTVSEYWEGKVGDLPLPAMPGQGCQCLSNCRCNWRIEWIDRQKRDADAFWEINKTVKNCQTCKIRHRDWYPVKVRGGQLV
jgi:hypothetical protein